MTAMQDKTAQTWALALGSVASLIAALDAMVVSTALTEIGREFDASIEALEWTVNAYTLSFAVLLMTAAAVGDRYGRRRIFAAGLGLFVVASAACALAPGIGWLIAARAVQGIGAAMIMPLALAQVSAAFPPERQGWALGIYSSVNALSTVLGPLVGGAITQGIAWQWIFWVNVPIGLVALGLALLRLRETYGQPERIDIPGLILVTGSGLGLVWGLVRGNVVGWTSAELVGSLGGGLLLAALFIWWQRRAVAPMLPMRLFRHSVFAAGNVAMFLLLGALMGAIFFMAQFQQVALGQGPFAAGLRLLPWGIALVAAAPFAGRIAMRIGDANAVALGLLMQASGFGWLAAIASPELAYWHMLVPMIAAGAGFAIAIPIAQKAVVSAVAPSDIGKASGTLSMVRQLGSAFGLAVTVAAFSSVGSRSTPAAFAEGFAAALATAAVLSLAGAVAGLRLARKQAPPELGLHPAGKA
ncbi:DHA2 family efflux MFS transporter permease subunit [soil metagenome]